MNLRDAVAVLNRFKHREYEQWDAREHPSLKTKYAAGEYYYDNLSEFEAIAVAEKYLREEGTV